MDLHYRPKTRTFLIPIGVQTFGGQGPPVVLLRPLTRRCPQVRSSTSVLTGPPCLWSFHTGTSQQIFCRTYPQPALPHPSLTLSPPGSPVRPGTHTTHLQRGVSRERTVWSRVWAPGKGPGPTPCLPTRQPGSLQRRPRHRMTGDTLGGGRTGLHGRTAGLGELRRVSSGPLSQRHK